MVQEAGTVGRPRSLDARVDTLLVLFRVRDFRPVIGEGFQVGRLPGDLAAARVHLVVEAVVLVEPEPHPDVPDREQVDHLQRQRAGKLVFHAGVDVELVVDLEVVGRCGDGDAAERVAQLDEGRPDDRREEVEHLHAVVVLPVGALALDPVGQGVPRLGGGCAFILIQGEYRRFCLNPGFGRQLIQLLEQRRNQGW